MAYKNLVAEAIASRAEVFKRFRDWLCQRNGSYDYSATGLGWTLHDSSYATNENSLASNDYFVAKSIGESGKEDIYIKVTYSATSGQIQVQFFQYWNNTTHAGVNGMAAVNNWTVTESGSGTLYIYANLDKFFVFTIISTSRYGCLCGIVDDSFYDRTIAISSGAVSAGSNKVVTMDTIPTSWAVGGKVVVRDNTNMERVTISAISGMDVTFTSFAASYSAGCKFAKDYPIICSSGNNISTSYILLFGHNSTKVVASSVVLPTVPGTAGNPDGLDGEYLAAPLEITEDTSGYIGMVLGILIISSTGFTDLAVYTTPEGVNYRAFISLYSTFPCLVKEV